ncbi:MAG: GH3 auxin-responsive promoter family protein [Promethearchaeota archaeon]
MTTILKLLGKILYSRDTRAFHLSQERPQESQENCLKRILKRNQDTVYGRRHGFSSISTPEAFQQKAPLTTYDDMKPYYESISKGAENILYPDKTYQFMITSGTTGRQKYIPLSMYSNIEIRELGKVALAKIFASAKRWDSYKGHSFCFSAPAVIPQYKYGRYQTGYLTGILAAKAARRRSLLSSLNRIWPSDEVLNLTDWETKMYRVALEIIPRDIRVLTGLPSNLCSFFRGLIDVAAPKMLDDEGVSSKVRSRLRKAMHRGELHLGKLWPFVDFIAFGGIHIDPYIPFLESYFGEMQTMAIYQATEGYLGMQFYDEGINLTLNYVFFEFIPEDKPDARPRLLTEVKPGVIYRPIITTSGGFYRYDLGDHIRFTKLNPPTIEIIGRAKTVASLVGERLQEEQLVSALRAACKATGATIGSFTAVPLVTRKRTGYDIYIEFLKAPKDLTEYEARFDEELRKLNHSYNYERNADVISPARFIRIKPGTLEKRAAAKHSVDGAGKVPVVGTPTFVKGLKPIK